MDRICMHSPSASGGQPLYVQELLTVLAEHPRGGGHFEWVAAENLEPQFKSSLYTVHAILPRLPHKREFRNRLSWAANRIRHYPRCDAVFLDWLRQRPDITAVHFQEFSRSQQSLFRAIRQLGKKIFYTVHNIRPHAYPPLVPHSLWDHRARRGCKGCDALFVHTQGLRQELGWFLRVPHPPIEVVPHGVWTVPEPLAVPTLDEAPELEAAVVLRNDSTQQGAESSVAGRGVAAGLLSTIAGAPREAEYFRNEVFPQIDRLRKSGVSVELIDRFDT